MAATDNLKAIEAMTAHAIAELKAVQEIAEQAGTADLDWDAQLMLHHIRDAAAYLADARRYTSMLRNAG